MRKNELSELVTTASARVGINLTPSKGAETFQGRCSVYNMFGTESRIKDTLAVPKKVTLAQQSDSGYEQSEDKERSSGEKLEEFVPLKEQNEQSEDIERSHHFHEEEKFVGDDDSSGEKLEVPVSLKECKRFSICDSVDTNDQLQTHKRH